MKRTLYLVMLLLAATACKKELSDDEAYVNPTPPNANHYIVAEQKWPTQSSTYDIVKGGDNLFFISGIENASYYLAAIDASLNTLWKHDIDRTHYTNLVPFSHQGKCYVLIHRAIGEEAALRNRLELYDENGTIVASKELEPIGSRRFQLTEVKLAGLPDGDIFRFVFIAKYLSSNGLHFGSFSWNASDKTFSSGYALLVCESLGQTGFYGFAMGKDPSTTAAVQNIELMAWTGGNIYRLRVPELYSASGLQTVTPEAIAEISWLPEEYNYYSSQSMAPHYAADGSCDAIYIVVSNLKDDEWTGSTLIAVDGTTLRTQWHQALNVTQFDDRYREVLFDGDRLLVIGCTDGRMYDKRKAYGYATISSLNPTDGHVIGHQTFGDQYYRSAFNDAFLFQDHVIAVGYTSNYSTSVADTLPTDIVDIPAGNYNDWLVKVKPGPEGAQQE